MFDYNQDPMGWHPDSEPYGFGIDQSDWDRPDRFEEDMRRRPKPVLTINNLVLAVICIFIMATGFLVVTIFTTTIDNAPYYHVFDKSWTEDATIVGPVNTVIPTGNPFLTSITVNEIVGGAPVLIPVAFWSYDASTSLLTINNAVLVGGEQIQILGTSTLTETPTVSVFSVLGIALIFLAIVSVLGIVMYQYYNTQV